MGRDSQRSSREAAQRVLAQDILAAKKGDWDAKSSLARTFTPLLTSLAEKRAAKPTDMNKYIDAGKEGLFKAARKYKSSVGADRFQIFALDFIEDAMDHVDQGGGFFSRLFSS
jgi:DNA-directed RNA polymerase specialized sigma subunit